MKMEVMKPIGCYCLRRETLKAVVGGKSEEEDRDVGDVGGQPFRLTG